jgi:hypothetical protein
MRLNKEWFLDYGDSTNFYSCGDAYLIKDNISHIEGIVIKINPGKEKKYRINIHMKYVEESLWLGFNTEEEAKSVLNWLLNEVGLLGEERGAF